MTAPDLNDCRAPSLTPIGLGIIKGGDVLQGRWRDSSGLLPTSLLGPVTGPAGAPAQRGCWQHGAASTPPPPVCAFEAEDLGWEKSRVSWPGAPRLEKSKPIPAPLPAPCVLPGAATRRLMKREEAGRGLGQQATARGQCEAGGGRPSGRDRQSPHMGSRRSRPAPPWSWGLGGGRQPLS